MRNNLKQPASIHWHGMLQRSSVIMDGVAGVTQRAIPEATSQLYNFICDLPGTYWVRVRRGRTAGCSTAHDNHMTNTLHRPVTRAACSTTATSRRSTSTA